MMKFFSHLKYSLLIILFSASHAFAIVGFPDAVGGASAGGNVPQTPTDISSMSCIVVKLALSFVPYIIVIAVGAFLQGLVKYIGHGDDEEKRGEGIKMMIYGTLGFFFMVSVWSLLRLVSASFHIGLFVPQFKASQSFVCN